MLRLDSHLLYSFFKVAKKMSFSCQRWKSVGTADAEQEKRLRAVRFYQCDDSSACSGWIGRDV